MMNHYYRTETVHTLQPNSMRANLEHFFKHRSLLSSLLEEAFGRLGGPPFALTKLVGSLTTI